MPLKKYLPLEKYSLSTNLTKEEVLKRLSEKVAPRTRSISFFSYNIKLPYMGEINGNTFQICRSIQYRNSFLPLISGEITTYLGKTLINIKMRPEKFVLVFMIFWLGIVGIVCLVIIGAAIIDFNRILTKGIPAPASIPFVMFLFGCLLTHFAFKLEANKSKKFLEELFEGKELNN